MIEPRLHGATVGNVEGWVWLGQSRFLVVKLRTVVYLSWPTSGRQGVESALIESSLGRFVTA